MGGVLRFHSVACTHSGLVRPYNEDAFLDRSDLGLWTVADGMGGMSSGDVASNLIVTALGGLSPPDSGPHFVREVRERLAGVNAELRAMAAARNTPSAIGSTVAGLLVFRDHFACFWAGDSRVYRLRGGELDRLTRDHSLVQEMVDRGLLAPDRAESHPHASVIQRAVGVDDSLELDFVHARAFAGDIFLLCSDGLTRMVSDEELEQEIAGRSLDEACQNLLHMVLARGAKDNVTMILVACLAGDG